MNKPTARPTRWFHSWRFLLVAILAAWLFGNSICCAFGCVVGAIVPKPDFTAETIKDVARALLIVTDFVGDCLHQFINAP